MKIKTIKLGNIVIPNNLFLAPLAGYTNAVFREMCFNLGAGLTFTEMVSSRGIVYDSKKTVDLLKVTSTYGGIKACQIFGSDPDIMRRACESEALAPFEIIDVNAGCPMPKVYKNGDGSALLGDINLASKIVSECKKSGKKISVKFRIGVDENALISASFAKACEDAGADMITVHGRTRDKIYAGEVNLREIEAAKRAVNRIPVIANGGVLTARDADVLIAKTGADGVMLARGAMFNPWLFSEICQKPISDKKETVLWQLKRTREEYGERFACVYMRKMVGYYVKGLKNANAFRSRAMECKSCDALESVINLIPFD